MRGEQVRAMLKPFLPKGPTVLIVEDNADDA